MHKFTKKTPITATTKNKKNAQQKNLNKNKRKIYKTFLCCQKNEVRLDYQFTLGNLSQKTVRVCSTETSKLTEQQDEHC